jgi:hypothetical protein
MSLCVLVSGAPMERQDCLGTLCTWVRVSGCFHNVTGDKRVKYLLWAPALYNTRDQHLFWVIGNESNKVV